MKVAAVLLRWYKSFNINYTGYFDRRAKVMLRPWNRLGRIAEQGDEGAYRFIEIPLEQDITTIVGANESGKSHLLGAITKVLTGQGIPDEKNQKAPYSRTDLCHYTLPRSKNADDWPHIGLQFDHVTQDNLKEINVALGRADISPAAPSVDYRLTLVLAPDNEGRVAYLYFNENDPVALNEGQLTAVRGCLPRVEFIKSDLVMADQIPLSALIAGYGGTSGRSVFDFRAAQEIADEIVSLALATEKPTLPSDFGSTLVGWKSRLENARLDGNGRAELESLLFRDVLGIDVKALEFLESLPLRDRTHADSVVSTWNREIDEQLNLSHYWQQDDLFAVKLNYKQGLLYFEITDKTDATYTFRERSSGLRYFLSYYIQAKALELTTRSRNAIILMDEPDSFLSIIGQRNLLAVFESLVRAESSAQSCQLVYTTHSPFLINRNFPRRLRLVRKGDAEEGTQVIDQAMLRRYEPVRSALGIDCAQTLFMGATNLVVEGPTDQYLICELIRHFATPDNVNELLDLNSLVMVSAESAPSVEKVLSASQWGDEPMPATIVLLDSDGEGDIIAAKITGKNLKPTQAPNPEDRRGHKRLIEDGFVLRVGKLLDEKSESCVEDEQAFVTTEDLVPHELYGEAVGNYVKQWYPEKYDGIESSLKAEIAKPSFYKSGVAAGTLNVFNSFIHEEPRKSFDKMGVLLELILMLTERDKIGQYSLQVLKDRLVRLCGEIRRAISASEQLARKQSGKQAIQRIIADFFKTEKESSSVTSIQLMLERVQRDSKLLGKDGEKLDGALNGLLSLLSKFRSGDQKLLSGKTWLQWRTAIEAIRKNPLGVSIITTDEGPIVEDEVAMTKPSPTAAEAEIVEPAKQTDGKAVESSIS